MNKQRRIIELKQGEKKVYTYIRHRIMKSPNIYNHLGKETLNPKKANHQNSKSAIKKIKIPNRQCRGIYSYNCKA